MDISLKSNKKGVDLLKPTNLTEKVDELETKLAAMSKMFYNLKLAQCKGIIAEPEKNKDGVPIHSHYVAVTQASELPFVLFVNVEGKYFVGDKEYSSLSAAAEGVSGVRRSGWTFWHDFSGKSLKELYRS